jgi:formylmethanofuran--tetrahydromethanopterin N-formyltransferase
VGSRYKFMMASTNEAYAPVLKGIVASALAPDISHVLEIVIDGLTEAAIGDAMASGMRAASAGGGPGDVVRITAGNYGGKLGAFHFHLHELLR